jgi:hypothetical protein
MKTVLKYIILLMAIVLAGTVAYVSVTGLLKLFAGAGLAGAIIFWSMEIGKVVMTSAVHTYKKVIKWYTRIILNVMILATMAVTSIGIYGFLSSSYKESFAEMKNTQAKVTLLEKKRDGYQEQLTIINEEKTSLNSTISELSKGLSNNVIQYKDRETGQIITTTSSSTRRALEKQLNNATERRDYLNIQGDSISTIVFGLENDIVEVKIGDKASSELGPLIYLSDVTGMEMDDVMKWFIFLIMIIGDPQAVLLVIIFNSIVNQKKDDVVNDVVNDADRFKDLDELVNEYEGMISKLPSIPKEVAEKVIEKKEINEMVKEIVETIEQPKEFKEEIIVDEPNDIVWEESDNPKYIGAVDPVSENPEVTIMDTETGEIVHPKIEREQPTESPTESDESKTLEVTDNEDTYEENQPTELSTESVLENEVINIDTDNTKKYKLDIEELPEVESDKVNRYNVELPTKKVNIEKLEDKLEDEDKYWLEDMESETEQEVKTKVNEFIKGKAKRTNEGVKVEVDLLEGKKELSEEDKKQIVTEILDKKNTSDRGFSRPIPDRPITNENQDKNVIIRKRK